LKTLTAKTVRVFCFWEVYNLSRATLNSFCFNDLKELSSTALFQQFSFLLILLIYIHKIQLYLQIHTCNIEFYFVRSTSF